MHRRLSLRSSSTLPQQFLHRSPSSLSSSARRELFSKSQSPLLMSAEEYKNSKEQSLIDKERYHLKSLDADILDENEKGNWRINSGDFLAEEAFDQQKIMERLSRKMMITEQQLNQSSTSEQTTGFIGIDLGTSNSVVSFFSSETGKPKIIPSPTGSWVFPTAVGFHPEKHDVQGFRVFGEEARALSRELPGSVLMSGKRFLGKTYAEIDEKTVGRLRDTMKLDRSDYGEIVFDPGVVSGGAGKFTVTHVMGMFIHFLKRTAESYLKQPVTACVITVPAYYTANQKRATEDAALVAGLDVLEILDEPTAACLSHLALNPPTQAEREQAAKSRSGLYKTNLVVDLGGGTLDLALLRYNIGSGDHEILATHGEPSLGGNDWDNLLSVYAMELFKRSTGIDLSTPMAMQTPGFKITQKLALNVAEKAKIHFSSSTFDFVETITTFWQTANYSMGSPARPLNFSLTYAQYEELTTPLLEKMLDSVRTLCARAGVEPSSIDSSFLVGAMTRDPPLRKALQNFLGGTPPVSVDSCPPDYAVGIGACVRAAMIHGYFPELQAQTKFLAGSDQAVARGASIFARIKNLLPASLLPSASTGKHISHGGVASGGSKTIIPSSASLAGEDWRKAPGVMGLSKKAIKHYSKEVVQFDGMMKRSIRLLRVQAAADQTLMRGYKFDDVTARAVDQRFLELKNQVRFWLMMVRKTKDHEEELITALELFNNHMDSMEGRSVQISERRDKDTGRVVRESVNIDALRRKREALIKEDGTLDIDQWKDSVEAAVQESTEKQFVEQEQKKSKRKVLRRKLPIAYPGPEHQDTIQQLVDYGSLRLVNSTTAAEDLAISETSRRRQLLEHIKEVGMRDAPAPPGESGSWKEAYQEYMHGDHDKILGLPEHDSDTVYESPVGGEAPKITLEQRQQSMLDAEQMLFSADSSASPHTATQNSVLEEDENSDEENEQLNQKISLVELRRRSSTKVSPITDEAAKTAVPAPSSSALLLLEQLNALHDSHPTEMEQQNDFTMARKLKAVKGMSMVVVKSEVR